MHKPVSAVTLLELIIAIVLVGLLCTSYYTIDSFSRHHVIHSERISKLQNEVTGLLDHMSKHLINSTGNEISSGANSVIIVGAVSGDNSVRFITDSNNDGIADRWLAYRFHSADRQVWYCGQCSSGTCTSCSSPSWGSADSVISNRIVSFTPNKITNPLQQNYIEVTACACWNPATGVCPNGTTDNPCFQITERIHLPSVSSN